MMKFKPYKGGYTMKTAHILSTLKTQKDRHHQQFPVHPSKHSHVESLV